MSDIYSFRSGPSYRGASRQEMFDAAMEQPLSITSTLLDQAKGGALESFGLGTVLRETQAPLPAPSQDAPYGFDPSGLDVPAGISPQDYLQGDWVTPDMIDKKRAEMGALTEDQYKVSPSFRGNIPYDPGMTEARASALATMDDAKKVREFYAQKRPFSAFLGNMAGQALDPINYVPVAGPLVKAAAIGRFGKIAGEALVASADAAANTGLFAMATAGERAKFGDDVSWQSTVSQIATAALIGAAFGAVSGVVGKRIDARRMSQAESRLATLRTTQESRIALNEGIDALANGNDIRLSPNSTDPMARVAHEITAYHGSPHDFNQFDMSKIGTGEGAQAFGHGLYFAESQKVAEGYRDKLTRGIGDTRTGMGALDRAFEAGDDVGTLQRLEGQLKATRKQIDRVGRDNPIAADSIGMEQMYEDAIDLYHQGVRPGGRLYEVALKAQPEDFLNWDKPLKEQSGKVREALRGKFGDAYTQLENNDNYRGPNSPMRGEELYRYFLGADPSTGQSVYARQVLDELGIPGIKYLDAVSRDAGDGSHNYVVFDPEKIAIRSKNGVAVDTTPARPDAPPEGIKQAEASIAKAEDTKALASQYRVDPQTGSFHEEAEIAQLAVEGRLTEHDVATMAQAQADFETGSAYAEALKSVAACLL